MLLGRLWATKEYRLNSTIEHCPAWIQILFMGRVIKSVEASFEAQKASEVLLRKKEGNLREGRQYRPGYAFHTTRMDVLRVQRAYQSEVKASKLYGRNY